MGMRGAFFAALACAGLSWMTAAVAEPLPTRAVTMIVPYGAGGPLDTLARIVSERMRRSLGQPVLIENITGASGAIGVGRAVRADPDEALGAYHKAEIENWWPIIKAANISIEPGR